MSTDGSNVTGVMPAMDIRSRLTGNRMGTLPFSDECFVLADNDDAATEMLRTAMHLRDERGLDYFEMRGAPAIADRRDRGDIATTVGLTPHTHFNAYLIDLSRDAEALRLTFQSKLRQMISKSSRMGVTVRRAEGDADLRECYRLYVLNRRRHGIPPQPFELYAVIAHRLQDEPGAIMYLAEYKGVNIASLVVFTYRGVTTGKYEGIDPDYRDAMPIHPLLWTSIREAAERGDRVYDLGRTAMDNVGLNEFKTRWGAQRQDLPYFYYPAGQGMSVVKTDSLKYRVFTGVFRRLSYPIITRAGARLFRHFG